jgi:Arc/MetJ family transcription regulator
MSRTNVDLDDKLVKNAMAMSALKTKKELIHVALEEFVHKLKRKSILKFMGSHCWEGDLEHLRRDS